MSNQTPQPKTPQPAPKPAPQPAPVMFRDYASI